MKNQKKKTKKGFTLHDMVDAAHKAGCKIQVGLEDAQMPQRLPGDPEHVTMLLDESERMNAMGNKWGLAKVPNPIAKEFCFRNGWALALAAAWLRCKLKGEVGPDKK